VKFGSKVVKFGSKVVKFGSKVVKFGLSLPGFGLKTAMIDISVISFLGQLKSFARLPMKGMWPASASEDLVTTMLSLHTRLATEQLPQRREQIQREIDATDRQIDALVYQLYGLTDEEIKIVEEATK